VVIFYCFHPGFHPIGWLGALVHLYVIPHPLSSWHFENGKLRHIMFSVPSEAFSTWRKHRVVTIFQQFSMLPENRTLLWAMIWLISFSLITGHCFMFCFSTWEALLFLDTKVTYVAKFPRFVPLYSCKKSRNCKFHIAKIYMRGQFLSSKCQTYCPWLFTPPPHLSPWVSSSLWLSSQVWLCQWPAGKVWGICYDYPS
jgi:hypothetical protein